MFYLLNPCICSTHLKRLSTLDTSWVVSAGSNGLAAHNSPQWMSLYLSVCKLLDLCLALPAATLPQFQMYRWAFVSEGGEEAEGGQQQQQQGVPQDFVPYVVRVARLLLQKVRKKRSSAYQKVKKHRVVNSIIILTEEKKP